MFFQLTGLGRVRISAVLDYFISGLQKIGDDHQECTGINLRGQSCDGSSSCRWVPSASVMEIEAGNLW